MAIVLRGMDADETADLTGGDGPLRASGSTGPTCPAPAVDKHSTGGVGDKTSLILAPLAAACGVLVPMMSGRGLGHTGGTLDKLESIPGFRVGLSLDEMRAALARGRLRHDRPDRRDRPGRPRPVRPARRDGDGRERSRSSRASIMSKKIAEGIDGLVLDVKCGRGAFMKTREDARGAGAVAGRDRRGATACGREALLDGDGRAAGPGGRQRAGGDASASRCSRAAARPTCASCRWRWRRGWCAWPGWRRRSTRRSAR